MLSMNYCVEYLRGFFGGWPCGDFALCARTSRNNDIGQSIFLFSAILSDFSGKNQNDSLSNKGGFYIRVRINRSNGRLETTHERLHCDNGPLSWLTSHRGSLNKAHLRHSNKNLITWCYP